MAYEPWGEESETVVYCSFCPGWKLVGPAHEVRELAREHRLAEHPDLPPPTRRRRANLGNWRSRLNETEGAEVAIERVKRMRILGIEPEVEA